jgi:hypothetical protein
MVNAHPVHHQLPINKPVFITFHAIGSLDKRQVEVSDCLGLNPVDPACQAIAFGDGWLSCPKTPS